MTWIVKILMPIVVSVAGKVVKRVSPEIRDELVERVNEWADRCYKTENKWDDIAADAVKNILSIPPIR